MTDRAPWPKADPRVAAAFTETAGGIEGVEVRKMFGFPAAFVAGNMAAGTHRDNVIVRLPPDEGAERVADGWTGFEPMPGRPMTGFYVLPAEVAADVAALREWIERGVAYARTLPPKTARARRRA